MAKFCNKFFPHLDWNKKANYFIEIRWETNLISQNASDHQYVTYIRGNTSKISKKNPKSSPLSSLQKQNLHYCNWSTGLNTIC